MGIRIRESGDSQSSNTHGWDSGETARDDVTGSLSDYGSQANIIPSSDHVLRNCFSPAEQDVKDSELVFSCGTACL